MYATHFWYVWCHTTYKVESNGWGERIHVIKAKKLFISSLFSPDTKACVKFSLRWIYAVYVKHRMWVSYYVYISSLCPPLQLLLLLLITIQWYSRRDISMSEEDKVKNISWYRYWNKGILYIFITMWFERSIIRSNKCHREALRTRSAAAVRLSCFNGWMWMFECHWLLPVWEGQCRIHSLTSSEYYLTRLWS